MGTFYERQIVIETPFLHHQLMKIEIEKTFTLRLKGRQVQKSVEVSERVGKEFRCCVTCVSSFSLTFRWFINVNEAIKSLTKLTCFEKILTIWNIFDAHIIILPKGWTALFRKFLTTESCITRFSWKLAYMLFLEIAWIPCAVCSLVPYKFSSVFYVLFGRIFFLNIFLNIKLTQIVGFLIL